MSGWIPVYEDRQELIPVSEISETEVRDHYQIGGIGNQETESVC